MGGQMRQIPRVALGGEFCPQDLRIASAHAKDCERSHVTQECTSQLFWQLIEILMRENYAKMIFACLREELDHGCRGHKVCFILLPSVKVVWLLRSNILLGHPIVLLSL